MPWCPHLVHETWEVLARDIHLSARQYRLRHSRQPPVRIGGFDRAIRSDVPPHRANTIAGAGRAGGRPAGAIEVDDVEDPEAPSVGKPTGHEVSHHRAFAAPPTGPARGPRRLCDGCGAPAWHAGINRRNSSTQRAAFRPEGPRFCAGLAERLRFWPAYLAFARREFKEPARRDALGKNSMRKSEPDRHAKIDLSRILRRARLL